MFLKNFHLPLARSFVWFVKHKLISPQSFFGGTVSIKLMMISAYCWTNCLHWPEYFFGNLLQMFCTLWRISSWVFLSRSSASRRTMTIWQNTHWGVSLIFSSSTGDNFSIGWNTGSSTLPKQKPRAVQISFGARFLMIASTMKSEFLSTTEIHFSFNFSLWNFSHASSSEALICSYGHSVYKFVNDLIWFDYYANKCEFTVHTAQTFDLSLIARFSTSFTSCSHSMHSGLCISLLSSLLSSSLSTW